MTSAGDENDGVLCWCSQPFRCRRRRPVKLQQMNYDTCCSVASSFVEMYFHVMLPYAARYHKTCS